MDIKQESTPSATGPGGEALSAISTWPERFYPDEHYYVADLSEEHGWQAYCEVLSVTPSGYRATQWSAGEGVPVTAYNWEYPHGIYDELYDSDDETLLIRLTPEQFVLSRRWYWPDLTQEVWEAVERQTQWLEALDGGFDGIHAELWGEFCRESFCRETLLKALARLLSGDLLPIPIITA